MNKLRIVLVDDQKIFAETLRKYIEISSDELQIIGIAYNGEEALGIIEELLPDLVLGAEKLRREVRTTQHS